MSYRPLQRMDGLCVLYPVWKWHYGRAAGLRGFGTYPDGRPVEWGAAYAGFSRGGRDYADMKAVDARRASYRANAGKRAEKAEERRRRPIEKAKAIAERYGRGLKGNRA